MERRESTGLSSDVVVGGLLFPESPRWHAGALWFSDMYAGRVYKLVPGTPAPKLIVELPDRPSGLGWLPDGRLLVVSMGSREILRLDPEGLAVHADLSDLVTGDPNDMVVDSSGRAYVGNFGKGYAEGDAVEPANLVMVEPDGTSRVVADDLLFPNGCVISPNGARLIVAEGLRHVLTEFTVEPSGELSRRREFADLGGEIPDGIALDEEGAVWVALPLRQQFVRVSRGGGFSDHISVDPLGAFACTLGGKDRRTLFMCTTLGGPEEIRNRASKGAIMAAQVPIAGAGTP